MLPWRFQSRGVVHTPKAESPSSPSYLPCISACCPLLPHPAFQPLGMSWQGHRPPMGPLFPSHSLGPLGASCSPQSGYTQTATVMGTHTYSYRFMHTCVHRYPCTIHKHVHLHSCTHTYTHTSAPTGIEIRVQIHTHTLCTYTPMLQSPRRSTLTHTLIPTQTHGHTHLHMDPCTLTHTHSHACTCACAHTHRNTRELQPQEV